jgi:exopolysaccharide production protein ExoZ
MIFISRHPLETTKNIQALQILRAIAALLVVVCHSPLLIKHMTLNYWPSHTARPGSYLAIFNHLDIGVDIFFCISGYIMALLLQRAGNGFLATLNFLVKRAIRIYPPYWVFTIIVIIVFLVTKGAMNVGDLSGNAGEDIARIIKSFLLIPQELSPVLGVGWTLIHEAQLYIFCGIVILLSSKPPIQLTFSLFIFTMIGLAINYFGYNLAYGTVFSPYYVEFLMGAFMFTLGNTATRSFSIIKCLIAILLFFGLAEILDEGWEPLGKSISITRQAGGALIGALLISGVIGIDKNYSLSQTRIGKLLVRIGDASYTLYLSHWFILSAIGKVAGKFPNASILMVVLVHLIGMGIAVLCALYISERLEIPVHKCISQRWENIFNDHRLKKTVLSSTIQK